MKFLIDLNILIAHEDGLSGKGNLSEIFQNIRKIPGEIFIHPESITEIQNDEDIYHWEKIQSKINSFQILLNFPDPLHDLQYISQIGEPKNAHDKVEIYQLYSLIKNSIDYLITEDSVLHKKASKLGIADRVFSIYDALDFLTRFSKDTRLLTVPPALSEKYLSEININDPIFDTLRRDYPDFNIWFTKKSQELRKCFAYYSSENQLGAILVYKLNEEEYICGNPPLPKKKRFKIATLKVANVGQKIGELLLKLSIEMAMQNNCEEVYLTHFVDDENDRLISLIEEYGFEHVSSLGNNEQIYLKRMFIQKEEDKNLLPLEITKKFYPSFYDGEKVQKWIIPIGREYHDKLFTDYKERQQILLEHSHEFIIEGNGIKKAYICNAPVKKISTGDIILFYRSHDKKLITTLGVVEKIYLDVASTEEIIRYVGKRTVYSSDELQEKKKPVLIIIFWHLLHFPNPISLYEVGISVPQTISQLPETAYQKIKDLWGVNERLIIN